MILPPGSDGWQTLRYALGGLVRPDRFSTRPQAPRSGRDENAGGSRTHKTSASPSHVHRLWCPSRPNARVSADLVPRAPPQASHRKSTDKMVLCTGKMPLSPGCSIAFLGRGGIPSRQNIHAFCRTLQREQARNGSPGTRHYASRLGALTGMGSGVCLVWDSPSGGRAAPGFWGWPGVDDPRHLPELSGCLHWCSDRREGDPQARQPRGE